MNEWMSLSRGHTCVPHNDSATRALRCSRVCMYVCTPPDEISSVNAYVWVQAWVLPCDLVAVQCCLASMYLHRSFGCLCRIILSTRNSLQHTAAGIRTGFAATYHHSCWCCCYCAGSRHDGCQYPSRCWYCGCMHLVVHSIHPSICQEFVVFFRRDVAGPCVSVCAAVCLCVRLCVSVCAPVCARVCACVCPCVRLCVRVWVCVVMQGHNPDILPPDVQRWLMGFVVREIKQESFQELERKLAPSASTSNGSSLSSGSNVMPSGANLTEESRELQSDGRAASATGPKKRAFIAPHCSISTGGHVLRDHTGKQAIDDGQPHDDSPVYLSCGYPKRNPTTRIIFPGKRTSDHISVQQTFRNSRTVGNFKPNRFCVVIWTVSTRPPSTGPHPLPRRPSPYPTGAGYGRPGAGAPLPATTAANAALVAGGAGGDVQHCWNQGGCCDAYGSVLSLHNELLDNWMKLTGE
eukprot:GHVU01042053.1.p1 GENE.GHVU01042053.1~~GHVU01042053.1.p1  ORF type:complete len:464 (+),score=2.44 GHVU01042053.1:453-1844(+)